MERRTLKNTQAALSFWLAQQPAHVSAAAAELALRRDAVTLLDYIGGNKVVGTQGAGNLPLKDIRAVTAQFVQPPMLEETIGTQTFRVRNEEEVRALHYLRILAEVGGLIKTGAARRWQVSKQGEQWLMAEPLLQTAFLLSIWWFKVNWLIAYPFSGMGKALPYDFTAKTLAELRYLPSATKLEFEPFAGKVIQATRLTWGAQDSSFAPSALRGSIRQMVIYPLRDFGMMKCHYQDKPAGKGTIAELVAFELTPLGAALLQALPELA